MVSLICNPRIWELEAEDQEFMIFVARGQPGIHGPTLGVGHLSPTLCPTGSSPAVSKLINTNHPDFILHTCAYVSLQKSF